MAFLRPKVPATHTEGPRLDSLQVTDSAYGEPIPICFGTQRLGGNIIWATSIREDKVVEVTGGGGGKGGCSEIDITARRAGRV